MDEFSSDHLSSLLMHLQGLQHSAGSLLLLPFAGANAQDDLACKASKVQHEPERTGCKHTEMMMLNHVTTPNMLSDAKWLRNADARRASPPKPPIHFVASAQSDGPRPRSRVSVLLANRSTGSSLTAPMSAPSKLVRWVDESPSAAQRRRNGQKGSEDKDQEVRGKRMCSKSRLHQTPSVVQT